MTEPVLKRPCADFVASCAAVALIAAFFLVPIFTTWGFWLGDKGWLEILTLMGTTGAASAAAWFAWKNYLLGQQKDIADRFERGVVLLEAGSHAKRIAGIIVLEDLALLDLDGRHAKWIGEFLPAAVNEWNAASVSAVPPASLPFALEATPLSTLRAVRAIARTRNTVSPDRDYLPNFYLVDSVLDGVIMKNVVFNLALFSATYVADCDLHACIIAGRFARTNEILRTKLTDGRFAVAKGSSADILFEGCDLSGTKITAQEGCEVVIAGCKVDATTVSGGGEIRFEDCWFDREPPILRNAFAVGGRLGIYRGDDRPRSSDPIPVWKPTPTDREVQKSAVASNTWIRLGEQIERREAAEDE